MKYFNALHKVPLVRWAQDYAYVSAHEINVPPAPKALLPLAHFKFTGSLRAKIEYAIKSGAYHNQSFEYRAYGQLLENMTAHAAIAPVSIAADLPRRAIFAIAGFCILKPGLTCRH